MNFSRCHRNRGKAIYGFDPNIIGSIMTGVFMFVCTGGLCLAALVVSSLIYKKRVEKLEKVDEDSMCDE